MLALASPSSETTGLVPFAHAPNISVAIVDSRFAQDLCADPCSSTMPTHLDHLAHSNNALIPFRFSFFPRLEFSSDTPSFYRINKRKHERRAVILRHHLWVRRLYRSLFPVLRQPVDSSRSFLCHPWSLFDLDNSPRHCLQAHRPSCWYHALSW